MSLIVESSMSSRVLSTMQVTSVLGGMGRLPFNHRDTIGRLFISPLPRKYFTYILRLTNVLPVPTCFLILLSHSDHIIVFCWLIISSVSLL